MTMKKYTYVMALAILALLAVYCCCMNCVSVRNIIIECLVGLFSGIISGYIVAEYFRVRNEKTAIKMSATLICSVLQTLAYDICEVGRLIAEMTTQEQALEAYRIKISINRQIGWLLESNALSVENKERITKVNTVYRYQNLDGTLLMGVSPERKHELDDAKKQLSAISDDIKGLSMELMKKYFEYKIPNEQ